MDPELKKLLINFFTENYSSVYESNPELKNCGDDYYYTSEKDSNTICLLPLLKLYGTMI